MWTPQELLQYKKGEIYMAKMNQEFAEKALTYVGKGPAEFRKWYYGYDAKGVAWCAVFASYVANTCGLLNKVVKKCDGVGDFPRLGVPANWGTWHEGDTKPQIGDLILFTWNGKGRYEGQDKYFSDHVGIVYKVDSKYVYTVEGNTNGTNDTSVVSKRSYALYSGVINGYYRPDWSKVESVVRTELKKGDKGIDVLGLKYLMMIAADMGVVSVSLAKDGGFGNGTDKAVKALQKVFGMKQTGVADADFIHKLYDKINKSYPVKGDMNGDGVVNIKDATAIQKHLAGVK